MPLSGSWFASAPGNGVSIAGFRSTPMMQAERAIAHSMQPAIETDRLLLRPFSLDDAPAFFELNSNREVVRYTGDPRLPCVEEARRSASASCPTTPGTVMVAGR